MKALKSAIYTGDIRHRRFVPKSHEFTYPIFMLYLDLDELEQLFSKKWYAGIERLNLVSFRRADFFAPEQGSLKQAVIKAVKQQLGDALEISSVRLLGHLRYGFHNFNPVVFYYCFNANDELQAILAEITNTPWGERHHYVLPVSDDALNNEIKHAKRGSNRHQFEFSKAFHVSPFNPMNMDYRWVFSEPDKSLRVHMDNFIKPLDTGLDCDAKDGAKHFDATLVLKRQSIEEKFGKTLIQYPWLTVKVISGIYWQAFRLWCKRVPFYDHPST